MFEKVKYLHAMGFGMVSSREKLEKNGEQFPQASYDELVAVLSTPEIVSDAVIDTKQFRKHFGKGPASYLAAASQFGLQYWIHEPFKVMPKMNQSTQLMYWALMFTMAQSGVSESRKGGSWEEHAEAILDIAKDRLNRVISEQSHSNRSGIETTTASRAHLLELSVRHVNVAHW